MSRETPEQVLKSIVDIALKGTLDLKVTRVLEAGGLALVAGVWSFTGTGPDGGPVTLTGHNADVLRRQEDGSWRFVIDNPWGTDCMLSGGSWLSFRTF
jgi:ketosteroid isomerase-like protein